MVQKLSSTLVASGRDGSSHMTIWISASRGEQALRDAIPPVVPKIRKTAMSWREPFPAKMQKEQRAALMMHQATLTAT